MSPPTPKSHWYHFTPDRLVLGLLAVQVFLFLSEKFHWFWFNEPKGWTVLIAVGVVCAAVLVMLAWGLVCLLLRRRFQFGFRSLLVFLVAVSVPLGWFAWELQKARRQREAVVTVRGAGAGVLYDYECDKDGKTPCPAWLRRLLGDDFLFEVAAVNCKGREFGDNDVRHLRELTDLEWLMLGDTDITDDGLEHLGGMTRLRVFWIDGTHITDKGLAILKELTTLEELGLDDTHTTDKGLAFFDGMTKLQVLCLDETQITDAGLEHLTQLTKLRCLYLCNTYVTDEGVEKLQEALPNCDIVR